MQWGVCEMNKEVEVIVSIPNLTWDNAALVVRDIRRTLENCVKLGLLDDYVVSRKLPSKKVATRRKSILDSIKEGLRRWV